MKERPILFSKSMVLAILAGAKTQTRRIAKSIPYGPDTKHFGKEIMDWALSGVHQNEENKGTDKWWLDIQKEVDDSMRMEIKCPYGAIGDQLWIRETLFSYGRWETRFNKDKKHDKWHFLDMTIKCDRAYQYAADNPDIPPSPSRGGASPGWHKRPAIFMPRWASRIQLEIINVRVERLSKINEEDAKAEGAPDYEEGIDAPPPDEDVDYLWSYQASFRRLWESINGAGSFDENPFVWIIEFKRIAP